MPKKYNLFLLVGLFFNAVLVFSQPVPGAGSLGEYVHILKGKKVGLVVNPTSLVSKTHLLDTLLSLGVNVKCIFGPEHGFRGLADAGEKVANETDPKTGVKVISLYGKNRKPTHEQMAGLDLLVFDMQDVGVRFYTYISTMHLVMEACSETNKPIIVLDRPNPNGMYVDGPVLDTAFKSFIGMHPVPLVYGLTIGEYARLINGERWLAKGAQCQLKVIKCKKYTHKSTYTPPVKPSPNLPNDLSIALYPSLGFFDGINVSSARGTLFPFQALGYPDSTYGTFYFVPDNIEGMAKEPIFKGKKCYGVDLRNNKIEYAFTLKYIIDFYQRAADKEKYFIKSSFNRLAGTDQLMKQIMEGKTEDEIRKTWQPQLEAFKKIRKKYLLYEDF